MHESKLVVPLVCVVHVIPSVDVCTLPAFPTATNFPAAYVTAKKAPTADRAVHVTPSGEVRTSSVPPVTTNNPTSLE